MKSTDRKIIAGRLLFAAVLIATAAILCPPAFGQGYSVMLQASPPDGGAITPFAGIKRIDSSEPVTLIATPAPGYQFMCWLGDVSIPDSGRTTIRVDSPKIVIAVFERTSFEDMDDLGKIKSGIGRGAFRYVGTNLGAGGGIGSTDPPVMSYKYNRWQPPKDDEQEPNDFPVPDDSGLDDFPVPDVPEPATMVLLGLPAILMLFRRHKLTESAMSRQKKVSLLITNTGSKM